MLGMITPNGEILLGEVLLRHETSSVVFCCCRCFWRCLIFRQDFLLFDSFVISLNFEKKGIAKENTIDWFRAQNFFFLYILAEKKLFCRFSSKQTNADRATYEKIIFHYSPILSKLLGNFSSSFFGSEKL